MLVKYQCNLCENAAKKIYKSMDKQPPYLTCFCGGVMEKQLPDFNTSSVEIIDNGAMARRVELRKDAVNRFKEKGDIYIKNVENRDKPTKKDDE